ncbi:tetratricopeptide repeat protein [Desulfocurvus sp. DL9XJH121]
MNQAETPDAIIPCPFQGVFSEMITKSVGFGGTKRNEKIKKFWFLERDKNGETFLRPLSRDYLPSGEREPADLAKAVATFFPEPDIYMSQVKPKLAQLERAVTQGDEHREKGELYSAEFSYNEALQIDEFHIRANFGLGLSYLGMGDQDRARHTFRRIVSLKGTFREEHKHLFNEFGIELRKSGMYEECLEYYQRALKLSRTDEHLFFNLARACYDNENMDQAMEFAAMALGLNPDFKEGQLLLREIERFVEEQNALQSGDGTAS